MKNELKKYSTFLLGIVLLCSCSDRPTGVLSSKEMEDALYDVYLAQALLQTTPRYTSQESKDSLLGGVLAKHKITQAQFDSSIVWYSTQGEIYYKINEKVSKRLQSLQNEMMANEDSNMGLRKKYDGFTLPPSVLIGGYGYSSTFAFEVDSLKFGQIDTTAFDFNFKTLGIMRGTDASLSLCFEYKDTSIYVNQNLIRNQYYSVRKPLEVKCALKKISGYIHVAASQNVFPPVFIYDLHYKKVAPVLKSSKQDAAGKDKKREPRPELERMKR